MADISQLSNVQHELFQKYRESLETANKVIETLKEKIKLYEEYQATTEELLSKYEFITKSQNKTIVELKNLKIEKSQG